MWNWLKRKSKPLGQRGEDAAVRYLRRRGMKILDRNVRLGRNEIDIIAQDGDTTVFVEVRTRATADDVAPEDTIRETKKTHLRRAAQVYMTRHGIHHQYRFDVVGVILPERGKPEITYYDNAFPGG